MDRNVGREGEQALHTLARYCRMTRVHMRTKKMRGLVVVMVVVAVVGRQCIKSTARAAFGSMQCNQ